MLRLAVGKIPTWLIAGALIVIGVFFLHWETAQWGWLDSIPSLREIGHGVGDGAIVAALLALAVDPFLKGKLLDEFSRGVFEHLVGFDQEPEIRAEIRKIAFETHL